MAFSFYYHRQQVQQLPEWNHVPQDDSMSTLTIDPMLLQMGSNVDRQGPQDGPRRNATPSSGSRAARSVQHPQGSTRTTVKRPANRRTTIRKDRTNRSSALSRRSASGVRASAAVGAANAGITVVGDVQSGAASSDISVVGATIVGPANAHPGDDGAITSKSVITEPPESAIPSSSTPAPVTAAAPEPNAANLDPNIIAAYWYRTAMTYFRDQETFQHIPDEDVITLTPDEVAALVENQTSSSSSTVISNASIDDAGSTREDVLDSASTDPTELDYCDAVGDNIGEARNSRNDNLTTSSANDAETATCVDNLFTGDIDMSAISGAENDRDEMAVGNHIHIDTGITINQTTYYDATSPSTSGPTSTVPTTFATPTLATYTDEEIEELEECFLQGQAQDDAVIAANSHKDMVVGEIDGNEGDYDSDGSIISEEE